MKKIQIQLFDFLLKNEKIYPLFFRKAEQSLESLLRYLIIQKVIYKMLFWNVKNKKYLVFGLKYKDIIESLPKNETVVLGGGKSTLFYCLKNKISSLFIYHYFKYLLPFGEKVKYNSPALINAIDRLSHTLNKTGAKFLILETDSLPAHRMLVYAAKKVNIKTICIYHGVMSSNSVLTLRDGYVADYVFVYDNNQKKILIDSSIDEKKIFVFGFYYSSPDTFPLIVNRQDICVLGQPWKEYDADKFNNYYVSLEWIFRQLFEHGFNVIYKPHPGEKELSYIYEISEDIIVDRSNIKSCLMKYDVFVSNASTALLEATLHGKLAIQVYTGNLFDDKLEENHYAYTVNVFDNALLLKHLKNSYPIQPTELIEMTRTPLEIRFKELLLRLDDQK